MKFTIYGEAVTISEERRNQIEEQLSFLSKYIVIDETTKARVVVKKFDEKLKIEITIPTKVGILRSEVINDSFDKGIDLAIEKIEDQIRRNKDRLSRRHKESLADSFKEQSEQSNDKAVRSKIIYVDAMDQDEAIAQMDLLGHSFFAYKDVDNKHISLVYKRNDGKYGLLEIID